MTKKNTACELDDEDGSQDGLQGAGEERDGCDLKQQRVMARNSFSDFLVEEWPSSRSFKEKANQ